MTINQQLKKRKLYDKKGKFKGYKGQVTFTPNLDFQGFAGIINTENGKKWVIKKNTNG
jgi:hypothetical protein